MNLVDNYLKSLTENKRLVLQQLRKVILTSAPGVEEYISTGVPAFRYRGRYLVSMGASKNHLSLFVMQGEALREIKEDLTKYEISSKVIRFTESKPLSISLVKKILYFRFKEINNSSITQ